MWTWLRRWFRRFARLDVYPISDEHARPYAEAAKKYPVASEPGTPEIPSQEQMENEELGALAARMCGDTSNIFPAMIRYCADRLGHQTMRAILYELRYRMVAGTVHDHSRELSKLIRAADLDASELGTLKT